MFENLDVGPRIPLRLYRLGRSIRALRDASCWQIECIKSDLHSKAIYPEWVEFRTRAVKRCSQVDHMNFRQPTDLLTGQHHQTAKLRGFPDKTIKAPPDFGPTVMLALVVESGKFER